MVDPVFRRLPAERTDEYRRAVSYAFEPENGPAVAGPDDAGTDTAESGADTGDEGAEAGGDAGEAGDEPGEHYGVFVGEELCSVCKHYDFTARLRGEWVPLAGLAAVATPPEHRRQGYVRHAVVESLDRWRGASPLSALWPFDHGYYRQFGWATANQVVEYTCPPGALAFARDEGTDDRRRVTADEWATLRDAHEAHAADRTLTLRRDEAWWRRKVFRVGDDDRPFVYACERDGRVRGHVVYTFERTGDGPGDRRIDVLDLAFADHRARLSLLAHLADHDSHVTEVVCYHENPDLLSLTDQPREVDCEVHAGPMVRVVDVADALAAVPYPAGASADLTLSVTDGTAQWNDDTFRLSVADGAGECDRVDESAAAADATLDIGTLSQLVVGTHSVADARRLADLSVTDQSVADSLAALFPPETVYLRTFF